MDNKYQQLINQREAEATALMNKLLDTPDEEFCQRLIDMIQANLVAQVKSWAVTHVDNFLTYRFNPAVGGVFSSDETLKGFLRTLPNLKVKVTL